MRRQILREMDGQRSRSARGSWPTSLTQPLSNVSYHVRVLADCGVLELVRTRQVRGSMQHFYRVRWRPNGRVRCSGSDDGAAANGKRAGGRDRLTVPFGRQESASRGGDRRHPRSHAAEDARGRVRRPPAGARPPPHPGHPRRAGPRSRRGRPRASPSAMRSSAPCATWPAPASCTGTTRSSCRAAPPSASTSCCPAERRGAVGATIATIAAPLTRARSPW